MSRPAADYRPQAACVARELLHHVTGGPERLWRNRMRSVLPHEPDRADAERRLRGQRPLNVVRDVRQELHQLLELLDLQRQQLEDLLELLLLEVGELLKLLQLLRHDLEPLSQWLRRLSPRRRVREAVSAKRYSRER